MTRFRRNPACEEARAWAALAPDGELSEFERASLRGHVSACGSCARFAAQVDRIAALLRLDEPVPLPQPVSLRVVRRRSLAARTRPVAAVAAVALMALGVASRSPLPVEPRQAVGHDSAHVSPEADRIEMESIRRQQVGFLASDVELLLMPTPGSSRAV